ncbi:MAG: cytochrome c [Bacteroidota bacterium]
MRRIKSILFIFSIAALTSAILYACGGSASDSEKSANVTGDVKLQQYKNQGRKLYIQYCANCHQVTGAGLGLVYPPLNKSDYMDSNLEKVICLMKNGISGEITVNGKVYNQAMPGISTLTNLEIAEIATYIYNTWEHDKGLIKVTDVEKIINQCEQ